MYLKVLLVVVIYLVMFYAGYNKLLFEYYLRSSLPGASSINLNRYQDIFSSNIWRHPKFISIGCFMLMYVVLNVAVLYILFPTHKQVLSLLGIYFVVTLFILFSIFIGFVLNNFNIGFGLVNQSRKVVFSPLLSFFLIVYYWKDIDGLKLSEPLIKND